MSYKPRWEGVFAGYARKFVQANHWRVCHTLAEPEDALQECAVVFIECARKYADRVGSRQHFMALYKRLLTNAFHDHARLGRRDRKTLEEYAEDQRHTLVVHSAATAELGVALGAVSPELQQVLRLIGTAPQPLLSRLLPHQRGLPKHPHDRAELSRRWCRLAGIAPLRSDLVGELQTVLAA